MNRILAGALFVLISCGGSKPAATTAPSTTAATPAAAPIGQLKPDGTFANAAGGMARFHLEGMTLVAGDRRITIDDNGTLVGVPQRERSSHVEGIQDDGSRRTALLVLGVLYGMDGMGGNVTKTHSAVGPDGKPLSGH